MMGTCVVVRFREFGKRIQGLLKDGKGGIDSRMRIVVVEMMKGKEDELILWRYGGRLHGMRWRKKEWILI